ncbi:MAG: hypothetical protein ACRDMJ_02735 [Solirubrobacteraceae bacterium]
MRAACIDIGSNTTRLLVAELTDGRLRAVHEERVFTRLGRGVGETGAISAEKLAEATVVVASQLAIAHRLGAGAVRVVATAAIRDAANGSELAAEIRRATGIPVSVLSGEEEARLAFVGAAGTLESGPSSGRGSGGAGGRLGVIDVGGGSCELVVGSRPEAIEWWASVPIGSGGLSARCLSHDPPLSRELAEARDAVAAAFDGLAPPRPDRAVAVGGGAASLARVTGREPDHNAVRRSLELLAAQPSADVARRFEIAPERARLLPAALMILQAAGELLGVQPTVGRGGIREGVLLETLRGG